MEFNIFFGGSRQTIRACRIWEVELSYLLNPIPWEGWTDDDHYQMEGAF